MAILSIIVLLLAGGLVIRLLAFGIPTECFSSDAGASSACEGLGRLMAEYQETGYRWAVPASYAIALLPGLTGLILGISLVAKELDQGTTKLAWSIGPSRRRWLLLRAVPILLFVVAASLAAGLIADLLVRLRNPVSDPSLSFDGLGIRGVVVAAEALSAFGIALLVGSVVGRLLPALFLAVLLVFGTSIGVAVVDDAFLVSESLLADANQVIPGRVIDTLVRTPEGEVITWEEAYNRYGSEVDFMGPDSPLSVLARFNPGEIYPLAVARMTVLHAALGFVALVLTFAVVDRRRP